MSATTPLTKAHSDTRYGSVVPGSEGEWPPRRSHVYLCGINAFVFAYGILVATFGLITLPSESERMAPKAQAVILACFLALAGLSQLSGPMAGFFSDRCNAVGGRRRPFVMWGTFVGFVCLLVLWWAHRNMAIKVYFLTFSVAMLALNVIYVAYSGALTDLVPDRQLGEANGLMGAFTVLGASAGFGMFSYVLSVEEGYLFYAAVLLICSTVTIFCLDERQINDPNKQLTWEWDDLWNCYHLSPTEHRDFFLVTASRTAYYMAISVQTFMLFYFRDMIGVKDPKVSTSYLALCGQLVGGLFCVPMGRLSDKVGRKPVIYLACLIIIAVYIEFMFVHEQWKVLVGGAIYGIGNGAYLSVDYALACYTLPDKDQAARFLGVWGVATFIGTMMGPLVSGPLLLFLGNMEDPELRGYHYAQPGYVAILTVGSLSMVASALLVKPIDAR